MNLPAIDPLEHARGMCHFWSGRATMSTMTTSQDLLDRIDGQNLNTRFLANLETNADVEVLR